MLRLIGKLFSGVMSFLAVLVMIAGGVIGYLGYDSLVRYGYIYANVGYLILLIVLGLLVALIVDVVVLGFVAQIVRIRKSLESIEEKLDRMN